MTRLDGYKIVVTAAGRDFGRSLATSLAQRGAELFICARDGAAAQRTRQKTGQPHRVHAFGCDLSRRLRPRGVRVMSLYPPDFDNPDRLSPRWETAPRTADGPLTAQSLVDCVLFAIGQPQDCFLRSLHFEQVR